MSVSTLFLRNFTCIDHAYVADSGLIFGYSYHQEALVTGEVEEQEQVVIDFSAVKKQLKQIIDDKNDGFDHKLWLIEGWSDYRLIDRGDSYRITTPKLVLEVPKNAVKIIEYDGVSLVSSVEAALEEQLETKLRKLHNTELLSVQISLNSEGFSDSQQYFTYWHGLKHSSSWGCQNIAHGHLSFVEVLSNTGKRLQSMEDIIASYLDSAMLYNANDMYAGKLAYTTPRGEFSVSIVGDVKCIPIHTDTTVENIVEHIIHRYQKELIASGAAHVYISEGLQKGAIGVVRANGVIVK